MSLPSLLILSTLMLLLTACAGPSGSRYDSSNPPAAMTYRSTRPNKPPMRTYDVALHIMNHYDRPTWLIFRAWGEKALPASDTFRAPANDSFLIGDFTASLKPGGMGGVDKILFLQCFGGDFIACRLPPRANFTFDSFPVKAWADISNAEVWSASELLVNDKIPLEEWVAARTHAPSGRYVTAGSTSVTPTPYDAISTIKCTDVHRWTIPITGFQSFDGR